MSFWSPKPAPHPEEVLRRFSLCCDDRGMWTLAGIDDPGSQRFPDLATALDCARRASDAAAATIEIEVDGMYICVQQPKGWPHRICPHDSAA